MAKILVTILADYKLDKNIDRALEYLNTLGIEELVKEASKTLRNIVGGKDSIWDTKFPNVQSEGDYYTMAPSNYLPLVYGTITSRILERNQGD